MKCEAKWSVGGDSYFCEKDLGHRGKHVQTFRRIGQTHFSVTWSDKDKPEMRGQPDYERLRQAVMDYMDSLADNRYREDSQGYLYEALIDTFYEKEAWEWINSRVR